jgi:hypothetical protein
MKRSSELSKKEVIKLLAIWKNWIFRNLGTIQAVVTQPTA